MEEQNEAERVKVPLKMLVFDAAIASFQDGPPVVWQRKRPDGGHDLVVLGGLSPADIAAALGQGETEREAILREFDDPRDAYLAAFEIGFAGRGLPPKDKAAPAFREMVLHMRGLYAARRKKPGSGGHNKAKPHPEVLVPSFALWLSVLGGNQQSEDTIRRRLSEYDGTEVASVEQAKKLPSLALAEQEGATEEVLSEHSAKVVKHVVAISRASKSLQKTFYELAKTDLKLALTEDEREQLKEASASAEHWAKMVKKHSTLQAQSAPAEAA